MQRVIALADGGPVFLDLPDPETEVVRAVKWGKFEESLTPAFWAAQAWMDPTNRDGGFALGRTLAEELVACLLGGHGAPAEVGLAAFRRVIAHLERYGPTLSLEDATLLLSRPLEVGGRMIRYRFAGQRARYLAGSLAMLAEVDELAWGDVALRDQLCELPGIGPKTASWIVRNRRGSDRVAILDVHIMRACTMMGVFDPGSDPARGYRELETRFLDFCLSLGVRASIMDAVMWRTMRSLGPAFMDSLLRPSNSALNPWKQGRGERYVGGRRRQQQG